VQHYTVASKSPSIELAEGPYTAAVSFARCGKVNDTFDIVVGSTYMREYWCTGGKIITQPPEVGYFDVENDTEAMLTIKVANKTYKVRSGSTTIELPEGSYKVKMFAKCGSTNATLEITPRSRY